jgi:hypothetical protein
MPPTTTLGIGPASEPKASQEPPLLRAAGRVLMVELAAKVTSGPAGVMLR